MFIQAQKWLLRRTLIGQDYREITSSKGSLAEIPNSFLAPWDLALRLMERYVQDHVAVHFYIIYHFVCSQIFRFPEYGVCWQHGNIVNCWPPSLSHLLLQIPFSQNLVFKWLALGVVKIEMLRLKVVSWW